MTGESPLPGAATDVCPHLLYCHDENAARFATWQLAEGHETLALFTSDETARKYRQALPQAEKWIEFQPSRDKLLDILHACRVAGIFYASLDPDAGSAKTLFDIPKVLAAAEGEKREPTEG